LTKLNVPLPVEYFSSSTLSSKSIVYDYLSTPEEEEGIHQKRDTSGNESHAPTNLDKRDDCKPQTLLWIRGTYERGEFGNILDFGPNVRSAFSNIGWGTIGLKDTDGYDAAAANNFCVGLPGGYACIPWLNEQVARCPSTKFVLGGYSQGAMVARICIAFADEAARRAVRGLLLFGDPMMGADNKGIGEGRIKTFCERGDGVCQGRFEISGAHLAYGDDIGKGVEWARRIVNS
jgi:cutinase